MSAARQGLNCCGLPKPIQDGATLRFGEWASDLRFASCSIILCRSLPSTLSGTIGSANNFGAKMAQFVNGSAEASQLLFENLLAERMLVRCLKRRVGLQLATRSVRRSPG